MKSRILFVAGLALFWPLLRNSFFGTFFSGSTTVLVPGLFYAALCAIAVLAWIRPGVIAPFCSPAAGCSARYAQPVRQRSHSAPEPNRWE